MPIDKPKQPKTGLSKIKQNMPKPKSVKKKKVTKKKKKKGYIKF